jgi:hypothetical protein
MPDADPLAKLLDLGHLGLARSLHMVADFGIADLIDDEPVTVAALAKKADVNADALGRIMRLLASNGIFEDLGGSFRHSASSRYLRSDHPQSQRAYVRFMGAPLLYKAMGALAHTLRTGRPGTETFAPGGNFAYLAERPEEARVFDQAMTAKSVVDVAAVVEAYDFSPFKIVGDIGGGRGHLLRAILEVAPRAKGVLFDLPHVVAEAGAATERLMLQGGDFFKDALPACDTYLLMTVIHDWNDESAVRILKAIRRAAPAHAKVLLIESLLPEKAEPNPVFMLDIVMLAVVGGRERKRSDYEALLGEAGFRLTRTVPTGTGVNILESVLA